MNRESIVVLREIGRGGNGIVEEVWPGAQAQDSVAMKRLNDEDRADAELLSRFRREVRIIQSLSHENIVTISHADLESDDPWFLMPLASSNVYEEIHGRPLNEDRLRAVLLAALDALEYAHNQGVIHRDLKPENILVLPNGTLVVSDFGLGRRLDNESLTVTITGQGRGTEGYAAPEQLRNFKDVDKRADIYALGSLLYEMSTGFSPRYGDPDATPDIYRRIVNKCRSYDPKRRYQTIQELREDFNQLWQIDELLVPRLERARELISTAEENLSDRRALLDLYLRNPNDFDLYSDMVITWSNTLIELQMADDEQEFVPIIKNLCDHLSQLGKFSFSYLDDVGKFLEAVYTASQSSSIQELILAEILEIGEGYNRFFLGELFADLARRVQSQHVAIMFRDVLLSHPREAAWVTRYIYDGSHPLILNTLAQYR